MPRQHRGDQLRIKVFSEGLVRQVAGDDPDRILALRGFHANLPIETPRSKQGTRQILDILVGGGQYEHFCAAHVVDAALHGHELGGIAMLEVAVGEFVHVVKEHDGRRVLLRFLEDGLHLVDEGVVRFGAATGERRAPACLDEAVRHERFARSRPTIQDQAARGRHAKPPIALSVFERVGNADELFLSGIVTDDVVEFVHRPSFAGIGC